MATPNRPQPKLVSNNPENFEQGGIYPGGTGTVQDIGYKLWDYGGSMPPDSVTAVHLIFQPTDGSNEGKPVDVYWSAGPSTDFVPSQDGGFVYAVGSAQQMRNNSNWHFVAVKLRDNCGMDMNLLDGANGIKCLIGAQLTLTRIDQPDRGIDRPQPTGAQGKQGRGDRKPTILIPTAAVFPWDKGGAARRPAGPKPVATAPASVAAPPVAAAPAPGPVPVPRAAAAPAPPSQNGTVDLSTLLPEVITELLVEAEGNTVAMEALPKMLVDKLGPAGRAVVAKTRMDAIKQAKDPAYITSLAEANGWAFDGTALSA